MYTEENQSEMENTKTDGQCCFEGLWFVTFFNEVEGKNEEISESKMDGAKFLVFLKCFNKIA